MNMKKLRDESGQVMILTVLCVTCLLGVVAMAVDVGIMLYSKRVLQTAADSAAIAGAAEIINNDVTSAAIADATENGVVNGVNGTTVAVHNPPSSGPHAGGTNTGYVEVIISQPEPTFFMRAFNRNSMTVTARAVATTVPSPACVYTLSPTGTDINLTGSGSLTISNCGIIDDSSSGSALSLTGSGSITAQSIGIVGNFSKTGSGSLSPNPPTIGITSVPDPLSSLSPPSLTGVSCLPDPNFTGSSAQTLGPATPGGTVCYNGITIKGSGSITFNPGLYIINGDFKASGSGSLTGTGGVTFYLPSGTLAVTGSGSLNFTAPTVGSYSGILFYQNPLDTNTASFTGSGGSVLNGIFYLPAAQLKLTGSGGATFNTDLVVGALDITGSLPLNEYVPLSGSSPLSNARMVE
jgi:Flp pilus assembly protein TadG